MSTSTIRIPTTIDTAAILTVPAGQTLAVHPEDLRELREAYRFCWPDNAPRDVFAGVRLTVDAEAPRLPRKRL